MSKPLDEFHNQAKSPDGKGYRCKACVVEYARERYRTMPDVVLANQRAYLARNRDAINARRRAKRQNDPDHRRKLRGWKLRSSLGITLAEYEAMEAAQDGRCAICRAAPKDEGPPLSVDHDHATGAVRGLLCANCNTGLGMFGDDLATMHRAMEYVSYHRGDLTS